MARVSNPKNQNNPDVSKLLAYCAKNKHWSVFEMANMVVEINTSRTIARQILRHRSFSYQEFSQRYADVTQMGKDLVLSEARSQDNKNRQNSVDNMSSVSKTIFENEQKYLWKKSLELYEHALNKGIAKEQARVFLPEGLTPSRMYMNGTIRSWIHYIDLRCGNGTQLEHKLIAEEIKNIFSEQLPVVAKAMGWR